MQLRDRVANYSCIRERLVGVKTWSKISIWIRGTGSISVMGISGGSSSRKHSIRDYREIYTIHFWNSFR